MKKVLPVQILNQSTSTVEYIVVPEDNEKLYEVRGVLLPKTEEVIWLIEGYYNVYKKNLNNGLSGKSLEKVNDSFEEKDTWVLR